MPWRAGRLAKRLKVWGIEPRWRSGTVWRWRGLGGGRDLIAINSRVWFQNILLLFEVCFKMYYFPYWKFYETKITGLWLHKTCYSKSLNNRIKSLHDKFIQLSHLKLKFNNLCNWSCCLVSAWDTTDITTVYAESSPPKETRSLALNEWKHFWYVRRDSSSWRGVTMSTIFDLLVFMSCDEGEKLMFSSFPSPSPEIISESKS